MVDAFPSINNVPYIQANYVTRKDGETITEECYHIEVQIEEKNGDLINYILETTDFETVVNIFKRYYEEHETPDITSWSPFII